MLTLNEGRGGWWKMVSDTGFHVACLYLRTRNTTPTTWGEGGRTGEKHKRNPSEPCGFRPNFWSLDLDLDLPLNFCILFHRGYYYEPERYLGTLLMFLNEDCNFSIFSAVWRGKMKHSDKQKHETCLQQAEGHRTRNESRSSIHIRWPQGVNKAMLSH